MSQHNLHLAIGRGPKAKGGGGLLAELRQGNQPFSQKPQTSVEALRGLATKQQLSNAAATQAATLGRDAASRAQMSNEDTSHFAMRSGCSSGLSRSYLNM